MIKVEFLRDLARHLPLPDGALDFLLTLDGETPLGVYHFGEDCYVNVHAYESKAESGDMEAHETYIDVQMTVLGEEKIYYTDKRPLVRTAAYDGEKDCEFYTLSPDSALVTLAPGEAVVLFPHEAHLPGRALHAPMPVKKAVLKLKMATYEAAKGKGDHE